MLAIFFLIFLGTVTWSLTMVKSGLVYPFGMGFWGPNGHDGVWHIALIRSLAKGSWQMPAFAGEILKNYHIGFDLVLAFFHKITGIPAHTLYFQIAPPFLAFFIGFLAYKLIFLWKKSKMQAFWVVFFVYFGGSFGWVLTFLREGRFGGESIFWAQQAISTLVNPPFAFSLVLMLLGLIFLLKYKRTHSSRHFIFAVLIFGSLILVKVYAGVLSLAALFVVGVDEARKKNLFFIKIFALSFFVSVILFFSINKGSANLIVFGPFWFLETMMGLSDRVGWARFFQAMTTYKTGGVWVKAIPAYILVFLIFWYGNMGTRFIWEFSAIRWAKRGIKNISFVEVFLISVILMGAVLPMLFLQKGTPWNTIQFFYYSLVFSGILAGAWLGESLENRSRQFVIPVALLIAVLTLPTTVATLVYHYLPSRPPAKISNGELEALSFLSKQAEGVVLTYPFNKEAAEAAVNSPPRPLFLYESTAYVSAFSGKPVFLEDEVNLDIMGYDWRGRKREVLEFLQNNDQGEAREFLKAKNISYIYWVAGQRAVLGETQLGLEKIFENDEATVYRVVF